jgi:hypothetical protein
MTPEEERGLEPHTPWQGALCSRNRSGSQPVFLPMRARVRDAVAPSGFDPDSPRFQRSAFTRAARGPSSTVAPCALLVARERKAEDSNLTRRTVRIAFQAISAPRGIALRLLRSGREDSNLRSPVPQTGALAGLSYALKIGPVLRLGPRRGERPHFTSGVRTRDGRSPGPRAPARHAERDISRARSPQYGCQSSGTSPSSRRIGGTRGSETGFFGCFNSFMPASPGVRLPLRSLHG